MGSLVTIVVGLVCR